MGEGNCFTKAEKTNLFFFFVSINKDAEKDCLFLQYKQPYDKSVYIFSQCI